MLILKNKEFSFLSFGKKKEVEFDEPTTYQDLCKKYPKLRELEVFIKNEDELHSIAGSLDDWRIIVDYGGFSHEFDSKNEDFPHFEDWTRKCREKLGSNSWIPCVGDLIYNKDDNSFYIIDLYAMWKPKVKKSSVQEYKKSIINLLETIGRNELLENPDESVKYLNENIIPRVKKILR